MIAEPILKEDDSDKDEANKFDYDFLKEYRKLKNNDFSFFNNVQYGKDKKV